MAAGGAADDGAAGLLESNSERGKVDKFEAGFDEDNDDEEDEEEVGDVDADLLEAGNEADGFDSKNDDDNDADEELDALALAANCLLNGSEFERLNEVADDAVVEVESECAVNAEPATDDLALNTASGFSTALGGWILPVTLFVRDNTAGLGEELDVNTDADGEAMKVGGR